jgi:hypothetical protein
MSGSATDLRADPAQGADFRGIGEHMILLQQDEVYRSFMYVVTSIRTRRTVQVATRKYRSRSKRR